MRAFVLALAAVATLGATARFAAADPDARQLYADGQAAFDAARYDDAIELWQQSYAASHATGLMFNLAQAYRLRAKPGDCGRAAAAYRDFLAGDASSQQREVAEKYAAETAACDERERAAAPPPPPTSPAPLAPVPAPASPPPPPPPSTHAGLRAAAIALIVVGAGGLGVGAYYGHRASSLGDDVTSACANGCAWSDEQGKASSGRTAEHVQWIAGGVGGAALVGGVALYFVSRHSPARSIAVVPHAGGAMASWGFSW